MGGDRLTFSLAGISKLWHTCEKLLWTYRILRCHRTEIHGGWDYRSLRQ